MSNMSYCRFQNTAKDLKDCVNAIQDNEIYDLSSDHEVDGLEKLLELSKEIVQMETEISDAVKHHNESNSTII